MFNYVIPGCPGGLFQLSGGGAVRIILASACWACGLLNYVLHLSQTGMTLKMEELSVVLRCASDGGVG